LIITLGTEYQDIEHRLRALRWSGVWIICRCILRKIVGFASTYLLCLKLNYQAVAAGLAHELLVARHHSVWSAAVGVVMSEIHPEAQHVQSTQRNNFEL
jgi:hypothetical protein